MKAVKEKTTEKAAYTITSEGLVEDGKFKVAISVEVTATSLDLKTLERFIKDLETHQERLEKGQK